MDMRKRIVSFIMSCLLLLLGLCGCHMPSKEEVDVYMPDGAPALALAYAMAKDTKEDGVTYRVVAAESIAAYVSGKEEEKNADLCVLPVNLAAKLLGNGERYQMLGVVTHGNLFLLGEGEKISKENARVLQGKTVGVVQLANVPGLVTKAALLNLGLSYGELSDGGAISEEKVNLKAAQPLSDLNTLGVDYLVAASPVAERLGLPFVASLQELYGEGKGYPQAVLVAKNELVKTNGKWLKDFLKTVRGGADWLKTTESETVYEAYRACLLEGLSPAFTAQTLHAKTIENANVYFTLAKDSKGEVKDFLERLQEVGAGKFTIADTFFYEGSL